MPQTRHGMSTRGSAVRSSARLPPRPIIRRRSGMDRRRSCASTGAICAPCLLSRMSSMRLSRVICLPWTNGDARLAGVRRLVRHIQTVNERLCLVSHRGRHTHEWSTSRVSHRNKCRCPSRAIHSRDDLTPIPRLLGTNCRKIGQTPPVTVGYGVARSTRAGAPNAGGRALTGLGLGFSCDAG
jgi:hypothetical protein